jgi:hypothetical protein
LRSWCEEPFGWDSRFGTCEIEKSLESICTIVTRPPKPRMSRGITLPPLLIRGSNSQYNWRGLLSTATVPARKRKTKRVPRDDGRLMHKLFDDRWRSLSLSQSHTTSSPFLSNGRQGVPQGISRQQSLWTNSGSQWLVTRLPVPRWRNGPVYGEVVQTCQQLTCQAARADGYWLEPGSTAPCAVCRTLHN